MIKKNLLILMSVISFASIAYADSEVVCEWANGQYPTAGTVNSRIQDLQKQGKKVQASAPGVAMAYPWGTNTESGAYMCVTLNYN
jgi:hypothetical protein